MRLLRAYMGAQSQPSLARILSSSRETKTAMAYFVAVFLYGPAETGAALGNARPLLQRRSKLH
jgi:hypothetical protein